MMTPEVLYEDDYVLIVNKPSGMVVNRGFGAEGETLQDWIKENYTFSLAKNEELRNGLVHRLDKETSGLLLIAKTEDVFYELQRQFKDREVKKTYIALLHGEVKEEKLLIDAPIARLPKNRKKFGIVEGGREATTKYKLIQKLERDGEIFSHVAFYPETGRTHQIRVHAKHIGHPIVSDYLYAGRKTTRRDRKWCPRLFLHASRLEFKHPKTGKLVVINTEELLPDDLVRALNNLRLKIPNT